MANLKFSNFTAYATTPVTATSGLVAYEGATNIQFTPTQLAPFTGIYAADGTIGTTRKALITDTIQFRNAGDTSDIFSLNTNGTFTLGKGATAAGGYSAVSIGGTANAASNYSVSIGNLSDATSTYAIAIGGGVDGAQASGQDGIAIGGNASTASGNSSMSIGYSAVTSGDYSINIGRKSRGTGNNAITLNTSGDLVAAPSTAKAFGVYMSSNTTPDFEIVGGGESTLNTPKFKITGQAYTELHTNATNLVVEWDDGNVQTVTISGTSPQFTPTRAAAGATYILMITQGATPTTIDWDGTVKWSGGAPTLSSTTGQIDVITLICYNATANAGAGAYYGAASLNLII